MNEFDQFMKRELKIKYYIRYADDFIILSQNKNDLLSTLQYTEVFLRKKLKLELHPDKVCIKTIASGLDFLGWVHFPYHRVLRTSTEKRAIKALLNNPTKPVQVSYLGLFRHGNAKKLEHFLNL